MPKDAQCAEDISTVNLTRLLKGLIISAFLVALGLTAQGVQQGMAQDVKAQATIEKAFPNSSKCKRCHERVFEEWETYGSRLCACFLHWLIHRPVPAYGRSGIPCQT